MWGKAGHRHKGVTGGLKLCLNLCHSPLTAVTPAQEVQQQRQQWPGSAVQFIFIGLVILGLILISAAPLSLDEQPCGGRAAHLVWAGRVPGPAPPGEGSDPQGQSKNQSSAYAQRGRNLESHWRRQVQGLCSPWTLPGHPDPFLTLDRDRDVAPYL